MNSHFKEDSKSLVFIEHIYDPSYMHCHKQKMYLFHCIYFSGVFVVDSCLLYPTAHYPTIHYLTPLLVWQEFPWFKWSEFYLLIQKFKYSDITSPWLPRVPWYWTSEILQLWPWICRDAGTIRDVSVAVLSLGEVPRLASLTWTGLYSHDS